MIVDGAVWGQVEAGNSVINELCRCCNRAGRSRCCCCVFGARESCERTWDAIWQLWIAFTIFFVVVVFTFDFTFANNEPAGAGPVSGPGTSSMESAWPASSIHSMHSIISLSLSRWFCFVLFWILLFGPRYFRSICLHLRLSICLHGWFSFIRWRADSNVLLFFFLFLLAFRLLRNKYRGGIICPVPDFGFELLSQWSGRAERSFFIL